MVRSDADRTFQLRLTEELGAIAAAQKEADEIRMAEKEAWAAAKADYESGVEGVGMALQVLRDYYAEKDEALIQAQHDKATGAATGIIGMLEVRLGFRGLGQPNWEN